MASENIYFDSCYLEEFDVNKPAEFFQLVNNNANRLADFFAGTLKENSSLEATKLFCLDVESRRQHKSYFPFIIRDIETEKYIGFIDYKHIDWQIPKAEIGYFIDGDFKGDKIMSTVLAALIKSINLQHKFRKLYCRIEAKNSSSIHVVEHCAFQLEGTIRYDYKTSAGRLVNLNYYGRTFEY